jgi:hypothetical protein
MIVGFAIHGILTRCNTEQYIDFIRPDRLYFFAKPTLMPIMAKSITGRMMHRNYIFERIEMKAAGTGE